MELYYGAMKFSYDMELYYCASLLSYATYKTKFLGKKFRHLPIVCFDNRLEPIPISMKNIGYRPIPIPIPILYKALSLRTAGLNLSLIFSKD